MNIQKGRREPIADLLMRAQAEIAAQGRNADAAINDLDNGQPGDAWNRLYVMHNELESISAVLLSEAHRRRAK